MSDRANERVQIFDQDGTYAGVWTHLGATQGIDIRHGDHDAWVITFRSLAEIVELDSMPGLLVHVELANGTVVGSIEAPGHWVHRSAGGQLFVGSLTGNVIRLENATSPAAPSLDRPPEGTG